MLSLLLTACEPPPEKSGLEAVYDGARYQVRLQQQRISVFDHQLQETIFSSPVSSLISAHQTDLSAPDETSVDKDQLDNLPLTETRHSCTQAVVDKIEPTRQFLLMAGHFTSPECSARFSLNFVLEEDQVVVTMATTDENYNHLTLGFDAPLQESILGFGSQASLLDFKGQDVPVWARQQGIGRGEQPISTLINEQAHGAAGTALSSELILPYFLSSAHYSVFLDNTDYSRFDFRQRHSTYIHGYSNLLKVRLTSCEQLLECINHYTRFSGRMTPLPDWTQQGAIVSLQGGDEDVMARYQQLKGHQVPVAAVWLKDWQQVNAEGDAHYPDWKNLHKVLKKDDVRLLGTVAPTLASPTLATPNLATSKPATPTQTAQATLETASPMYQEALNKGYLVKRANGETYPLQPAPFSAAAATPQTTFGLVDLTNPDAFNWLKKIIKKQVKAHQLSGWHADISQPLPVDIALYDNHSPMAFHNVYAQEWARLNHEVIRELNMDDEALLWMDSGFTHSPALVTAFSAGEQNTSWDAHDGLQSAVMALLNGGISGHSINHTDTGGATSLQQAIPNLSHWLLPKDLTLTEGGADTPNSSSFALHRAPELLQRWVELSAFTGLLRTDEGLTPAINAQVYDTPEMREHFAHNSRLFQALAAYRQVLMEEAAEQGWPLVRHPLLHFPNEHYFANMPNTDLQFMLGDSLMVAPMLTPVQQRQRRQVFLPKGEWIEVSTGKTIVAGKKGKMLHRNPPANQAIAYLRNNERSRELILPALQQAGFAPATATATTQQSPNEEPGS